MPLEKAVQRASLAHREWTLQFPVLERVAAMRRLAPRCVGTPATHGQLQSFHELTGRMLACHIPDIYLHVLSEFDGVETRSSVLYGIDQPNDGDAATWPTRGIVFASLAWLYDPKSSPWVVIGETDHDVLAISRDGVRFASIHGGTESVVREFQSLDQMLCVALDVMLEGLSPRVGGRARPA